MLQLLRANGGDEAYRLAQARLPAIAIGFFMPLVIERAIRLTQQCLYYRLDTAGFRVPDGLLPYRPMRPIRLQGVALLVLIAGELPAGGPAPGFAMRDRGRHKSGPAVRNASLVEQGTLETSVRFGSFAPGDRSKSASFRGDEVEGHGVLGVGHDAIFRQRGQVA